jgi:hypothetical protein
MRRKGEEGRKKECRREEGKETRDERGGGRGREKGKSK